MVNDLYLFLLILISFYFKKKKKHISKLIKLSNKQTKREHADQEAWLRAMKCTCYSTYSSQSSSYLVHCYLSLFPPFKWKEKINKNNFFLKINPFFVGLRTVQKLYILALYSKWTQSLSWEIDVNTYISSCGDTNTIFIMLFSTELFPSKFVQNNNV